MTNPSEPSGSSVPEAARAAAAGFSAERVREWSAAIQGVELAAPWHLVAACIDKADAEVAAAVAEERATTGRRIEAASCPAALNIAGEHFVCDWPTYPHDGWAHTNREAEAIWTEDTGLFAPSDDDWEGGLDAYRAALASPGEGE